MTTYDELPYNVRTTAHLVLTMHAKYRNYLLRCGAVTQNAEPYSFITISPSVEAPPLTAKSEAAFLYGDMGKRKLTEKVLAEILELIAAGQSLRSICDREPRYPNWRTFLQHVRDNDEIYARYRKARIDQAESLRDYLIELTQRPLPADKQMANAEVQRRKLEADVINRTIGSAQAKGLRDKQEDQVEKPTTLTIRWGDDGAAEVTTEDNNGLGKASVPQRSAREPLH